MTHKTRQRLNAPYNTGHRTTYAGDQPGDRYFVSPNFPETTMTGKGAGQETVREWTIFDRQPTERVSDAPDAGWDDIVNTYNRLYLANAECDRLNAEHKSATTEGANA